MHHLCVFLTGVIIGSPESRVFILVALARVSASNWFIYIKLYYYLFNYIILLVYIKPIARAYTRECHENKNTRFWATYGVMLCVVLSQHRHNRLNFLFLIFY